MQPAVNQGIKYSTGTENWQIFSYVCDGKKMKELFTPTWNGIDSSVRCVSSTSIVLNAKMLG